MSAGPRRGVARLLWWMAVLAAAAGAGTTLAGMRLAPPELWAGAVLALLGLNVLLMGELVAGPEPRSFTVRGQVVRGELAVRAGLADLTVDSCPNDRIATLRHGSPGRPKVVVEEGIARLRLGSPLALSLSHWGASLARNILWDVEVRSGLGDLHLDLSSLRVERVAARTGLGRLTVICPARGFTRLFLRSRGGVIDVRIPAQVGARLHIRQGALASLAVSHPRLQALDARRYATPDFDAAPAQVEITLEAVAGEVFIS